jgi:DNA topoisomerase-1
LEEKGIGRPSTYASILSTIQDKEYATKDDKRFSPTRLGEVVNELLVGNFPDILDVGFTAQMEDELDNVEEGKSNWVEVLKAFYKPFVKTLEQAKEKMKDIKRQEIQTAFKCEECKSIMVIKWGRRGEFLACSSYPKCKNTKEFKMNEQGDIEIVEQKTSDEKCTKCGSPMVVKHGRFGEFLACSSYPDCKTTKAISVGVTCPDCGGDVVQKRTRRGKYFYGCGNYPKCEFALWTKPVAEECPKCKSPYLVEKLSKRTGDYHACPNKECDYKKEILQ